MPYQKNKSSLQNLSQLLEKMTPLERISVERARGAYLLHIGVLTEEYVKQKDLYDQCLSASDQEDALTQQTLALLKTTLSELENQISQFACEMENHLHISA